MAWNPDYLDTFSTYTLSTAATYGKWTTAPTPPSAVTIAEDGMQGASGGQMTRTVTSALGHIVATRGSGTTGVQEIFDVSGNLAQVIRLFYDGDNGEITLVTPDGTPHLSTQIAFVNDTHYTYVLAYFYDGAEFKYALHVDGELIEDIGDSHPSGLSPAMDTLTIHNTGAGTSGLDERSYIAVKAYSGSGGIYSAGDLYSGSLRRGILRPDADGRWPATTPSRTWSPTLGTTYFGVLDETLAETAGLILNQTDPNGSPGGAPNYLDRASWSFEGSPTNVTVVPHVQFANLVQVQNGSATYSLYVKEAIASDTATAITPITAPASWTWRLDNYALDPRDSAAWSRAKLDTLEVAIEPLNFT